MRELRRGLSSSSRFQQIAPEELMYRGYIKLWRKIQDSELYKRRRRFSHSEAWIDLLLLADHKGSEVLVELRKVKVGRGQVFTSQLALSKRWRWSRSAVKRFLDYLKNETSVSYKTDSKFTLILILNWDKYQGKSDINSEKSGHQTDIKRTHSRSIENVEEAASEENTAISLKDSYKHLSKINRSSPQDIPKTKEFLKDHSLKEAEDFIRWYVQHPVWGKSPGAFCTLFQPHLIEEWEKNKKDNEWQYGG